jgi:hypothetical protein
MAALRMVQCNMAGWRQTVQIASKLPEVFQIY